MPRDRFPQMVLLFPFLRELNAGTDFNFFKYSAECFISYYEGPKLPLTLTHAVFLFCLAELGMSTGRPEISLQVETMP